MRYGLVQSKRWNREGDEIENYRAGHVDIAMHVAYDEDSDLDLVLEYVDQIHDETRARLIAREPGPDNGWKGNPDA
jgi:hypothetical protein